jgi:ribosomal-protein-alanine N-acetyltransferase
MSELQLLCARHGPAVLAFELENRAYFAASISDRGDAFFEHFAERLGSVLAGQAAGTSASYVYLDGADALLGRFNLYDIREGTARIGYRVAQHAAGRGVATAGARDLCELAATRHEVRVLTAATSLENVASQKVLTHIGFVPVGPADPADLGGKQGTRYQRDLTVGSAATARCSGRSG